jgi:hypothetical protein
MNPCPGEFHQRRKVNYFAISDDAASATTHLGIANCLKLARDQNSIVNALASAAGPSCIVGDVHLIDDLLASSISAAQRISPKAIGVIPFAAQQPETLKRLLRHSDGCAPTEASYVGYSVDTDSLTRSASCQSIVGSAKFISSDDPADLFKELSKAPTCFAAQLNGRQTFCFLDSHACIHPDSFGQMEGMPGIITPRDCDVKHFLIQSCHSPFRWSDFGKNYLSVPLGFMLRGSATTFVTSIRVQSLVPDLIPLYIACANDGMSVGEIVLELNAYCRALQIDDDPFLLFGHPNSQIVRRPPSLRSCLRGVDSRSIEHFRSHLFALGNVLQNLRFSRDYILGLPMSAIHLESDIRSLIGNCSQHLRSIKKKGQLASADEIQFQANASASAKQLESSLNNIGTKEKAFSEQIETLSRAFSAQTKRFRSPEAISAAPTIHEDLETFTAALLRTGQKTVLNTLSAGLLGLWKQRQGYYYFFSDNLERLFMPDSPFQTNQRCASCGSSLLNKPQRYVGLNPCDDYRRRELLVCPRCLVVRDASLSHSASIDGSLTRHVDAVEIQLTYRNSSRNPQWVFGSFHLNDPNNVSANLPSGTFKRLLEGLNLGSSDWRPRTVGAGELWRGTISVTGIPENLFYLLIECHLFIDGCWNWLSFTLRKPHLDEWLKSDEYRSTLPQNSV